MLVLGNRRETSQHRIQIATQFRNSRASINGTGNHCRVQFKVLFHELAYVVIEITSRISKSCENDDFLVALIDRMLQLILDNSEQFLELAVVFRCDVSNHQSEKFQYIPIFYQTVSPRLIIHISDFNFDFLAEGEQFFAILIFCVKFINIGNVRQLYLHRGSLVIGINAVNGGVNQPKDSFQCQIERIHRAFHSLH